MIAYFFLIKSFSIVIKSIEKLTNNITIAVIKYKAYIPIVVRISILKSFPANNIPIDMYIKQFLTFSIFIDT